MWSLFMGNSESTSTGSSDEEEIIIQQEHESTLESTKEAERKAGDGEEVTPPVNKNIHIVSPNLLENPPPIACDEEVPLPQKIPSSALIAEKPFVVKTNVKCRKKTNKEPKFVPYEPYKAAVTPLVHHPSYLANKKPTPPKPKETPTPKSFSIEENQEVKDLQEKLNETERNLKIQIQVNSEVKKLLVASVGEDLEARVDFLTQDKARLASDLRQYANRISRDFEEKETLSVESNLWKSKFLACSLLVDDLARWKASLVQINQDYEHTARVLLHEHSVLWNILSESLNVLTDLNDAFDPLDETFKPAEAASLLGISDYVLNLSKILKKRLMKDLKSSESNCKAIKPYKIKTPAEEKIDTLLRNPLLSTSLNETDVYNKMACNAVTGVARVHLQKLKDKRSATDFKEFKSCTHCQGNIQNI